MLKRDRQQSEYLSKQTNNNKSKPSLPFKTNIQLKNFLTRLNEIN